MSIEIIRPAVVVSMCELKELSSAPDAKPGEVFVAVFLEWPHRNGTISRPIYVEHLK